MIWLLSVLYRVLRWIGEKVGLRFGGRVSASAHNHALNRVERGLGFDKVEASFANAPCCARIELGIENDSPVRIDVVGVSFRVGRLSTSGTFHRLVWSADVNGPPPTDVNVSDEEGYSKRITFEVALPASECLAAEPKLWLDGTVRLRVWRAGRARFKLGELDVSLPSTCLSLDEDSLSRTERDRLAADRTVLRERLDPTEPERTTGTTPTDEGETGTEASHRNGARTLDGNGNE